ncbi:hypothetical protein [Pedobacter caeni]|uniref:Uncharacterized protein n=1 Tax=Pedobacter caeni TaxID=288992 RepID=A0A1M4WUL6_9SPHI|nr:hypothetical protein [Pedobacter caeni]SHE84981.1 hypothetical protein SAMN04488522_1011392 [Pedobacter caeni]
MDKEMKRPKKRTYEEPDNLGLDADQSSESFSYYSHLNTDNDRISGNPDGEDDNHNAIGPVTYTPLMDK